MRTTHTHHALRHTRRVALTASLALVGALGLGSVARAQTPEPPTTPETTAAPETTAPSTTAPAAAGSTFTLPLFGAALTVDLTTGAAGNLTSVAVNPADGFTAVTLRPNKVAFVNDSGTARVVVKSGHGGQRVEAKAGSLGEISGPGGWSGDVFETGAITTVAFTIADRGDGTPDITGTTTSDPTATVRPVEYGGDDGRSGARQAIEFVSGSLSRTLVISAGVKTLDDGTTRAAVRISLSRIHGAEGDGAEGEGDDAGEGRPPASTVPAVAAGPQHWEGPLCDGTTATIDYVIGADGAITGVVVSPAPTKQKVEGKHLDVRFAGGEKVRIDVKQGDGGAFVPRVDAKVRCPLPTPTVNTPISTTVTVPPTVPPTGTPAGDGQGKGKGKGRDGSDDAPRPSVPTSAPTTGSTPPAPPTSDGGEGRKGGRKGQPPSTTVVVTTPPPSVTSTTAPTTTLPTTTVPTTTGPATTVPATTVPPAPSTEPSTTNA